MKAATQKRVTLSRINAALAAKGWQTELVRGRGYFYLIGDDMLGAYTESIYVNALDHMTLDRWVSECVELLEENKRHSAPRVRIAFNKIVAKHPLDVSTLRTVQEQTTSKMGQHVDGRSARRLEKLGLLTSAVSTNQYNKPVGIWFETTELGESVAQYASMKVSERRK